MFALVPSALEECGVSPTPAETGRTGPVSAPWAADSATRLAPGLAARRWSPDSARTLLSQRSAQATSSSTLLESLLTPSKFGLLGAPGSGRATPLFGL